MIRRSVRLLALGTVAMACASALAPSAQAEDFLSALFGAFGARPHAAAVCQRGRCQHVRLRRPKRVRATPAARPIACAAATDAISRSRDPTIKAARRPATASVRPARPSWSMAAVSTAPRPKPESPIPNCRMRFAIATRSWRAVPATARIRSALPRSRSRTIRRFARAISLPAPIGLMTVGRGADRRGAALNFSPAPQRISARYQRVPVVASE